MRTRLSPDSADFGLVHLLASVVEPYRRRHRSDRLRHHHHGRCLDRCNREHRRQRRLDHDHDGDEQVGSLLVVCVCLRPCPEVELGFVLCCLRHHHHHRRRLDRRNREHRHHRRLERGLGSHSLKGILCRLI